MDNKMNLEIGDWVDIGYRPAKVLCVSSDGYVNVSEVYEEISIGCLKPIPITSEILEKNGFKLIEKDLEILYYKLDVFPNRCIANLNNDNTLNITINTEKSELSAKINYVHELQHALRLCVIDKDIEL